MLEIRSRPSLKGYFERIQRPIELVASLDDSEASRETLELLRRSPRCPTALRSLPTATIRAGRRSPSARPARTP